jgi:hypothetical protein
MVEPLDAVLAELGIAADVLDSRGLWRQQEAIDLEVAETGADGREHRLVPSAASAWRDMKAAALADGIFTGRSYGPFPDGSSRASSARSAPRSCWKVKT